MSKLRKNRCLFQCKYFTKNVRSHDSSVCCYNMQDSSISFGRILFFITNFELAVIMPYHIKGTFLSNIRQSWKEELRELREQLYPEPIFFIVTPLKNELKVILVSDITNICVCHQLENNIEILVRFPNHFEFH